MTDSSRRRAVGRSVGPTSLLAALALAAMVAPAAATEPAPSDKLTILFATGSATVDDTGVSTLDHAARLYRAGHPVVMIVSGSADRSGSPARNLTLSERRARNVLDGLVDRGIPVDRLQLLAKGVTDPVAAGTPADPAPENRRVEITWR